MRYIVLVLTLILSACSGGSGSGSGGSPAPTTISLAMSFEQGPPGEIEVRTQLTVQTGPAGFIPDASFLGITADFGTLGTVTVITVPGAPANQTNFSTTLMPPRP